MGRGLACPGLDRNRRNVRYAAFVACVGLICGGNALPANDPELAERYKIH